MHLQQSWKAFCELNGSRQAGDGGCSPIMVGEILAWLDLYEVEGDERLVTYRHVKFMDAHWMKWDVDRRRAELERSKKRANPTARHRR